MSESNGRESFKVDINELGDRLGKLVHEGNVRRVIVKREEETIAEFPLTAGVIGAVLAPPLAAIGAIAALVANCTIEVERTDEPGT
ncbi:MAG: DUF4342 domain-containing protein [Dehalococcoidia bacterium]